MPGKPAKYCSRLGCQGIVRNNLCSVCGLRKRTDDVRPSARQRGYDKSWERLRRAYLAEHPLCERCAAAGVDEAATVVHHKVRHRGNPELLYDWEKLEALCKPCHDKATGRGE